MSRTVNYFRLRLLAAMMVTLSGIAQVASLWFRELTGAALLEAMMGVTYIIIGIGLQGQSRFTLFMAIGVPAAAAALVLNTTSAGALPMLQIARLVIDLAVILCSGMVLLHTRK